jgi:ABC-type phosphate transport system substrate-binding protein
VKQSSLTLAAALLATACGPALAQGRSPLENPMTSQQLAYMNPHEATPGAAPGAVASVVNVEGVKPGRLKLTGAVLADIYLGKITRWDALQITTLNPELTLPHERIVVVRRSDVSAPTLNFAAYLAAQSATFRAEVGKGAAVHWPVGFDAQGDEGVAAMVARTRNAIGFMDFATAERSGLAVARLIDGKSLPKREITAPAQPHVFDLNRPGLPMNPASPAE